MVLFSSLYKSIDIHMLTIVCRTKVSKRVYYSYHMKREVLIKFGNKVREQRLLLGLSQEELASRAGVHRTYVGMIERAEKNITLTNVEKIAKALKLSIDEITKI